MQYLPSTDSLNSSLWFVVSSQVCVTVTIFVIPN